MGSAHEELQLRYRQQGACLGSGFRSFGLTQPFAGLDADKISSFSVQMPESEAIYRLQEDPSINPLLQPKS